MIFNIMLLSNQSGNITPRLPPCARHVGTLLSRAQLLRIIISASRTRVRHREDKSPPTSPPHRLHGAGIPASPHGRFIKPASTTSRPASLDRGLHHLFINLLRRLRRRWPISSVRLAGPRALPRRANLCQHRHAVALSPIKR